MAKKAEQPNGGQHQHFSAFGGHPLSTFLTSLKSPALESYAAGAEAKPTLSDLGITDAEQLVAVFNMENGRDKLAETLDTTKTDLDNLVKEAKKILPSHLAAEMEQPLPPMYALGVADPTPEMEAETEAPPVTFQPAGGPSVRQTVNLISKMSKIRNQGARGTCVAFCLSAIHEYFRRTNGAPEDFSEQHLYHEMKLIDGIPNVCGTYQREGAKVLNSQGQCREDIWEYNPNEPCNNNGVMPPEARPDAADYKLQLQSLSPKSVSAIKGALNDRRPVGISVPVYDSWFRNPETKRSGRITMPLFGEPRTGGHCMCVVGFQDSSFFPGGGYFLLRNSWGTGWGHQCPYGQGYGSIPYKYIAQHNWEAYTLASSVDQAAPVKKLQDGQRTITITVRGNVNLVIE